MRATRLDQCAHGVHRLLELAGRGRQQGQDVAGAGGRGGPWRGLGAGLQRAVATAVRAGSDGARSDASDGAVVDARGVQAVRRTREREDKVEEHCGILDARMEMACSGWAWVWWLFGAVLWCKSSRR